MVSEYEKQIAHARELSRVEKAERADMVEAVRGYRHGPAQPNRIGNKRPQGHKTRDKPAVEGHEQLLKMIQGTGGRIAFYVMSLDSNVEGVVKRSDKFTVSVTVEKIDISLPDLLNKTVVFFKHDISFFIPLQKPLQEETDQTSVITDGTE